MTSPPSAQPRRTTTHALEYLQIRGYYSTAYTEIVQPERIFALSHYFRRHWLPLLKPGPAWLVVGLRQRCFWNQQQNWCVISREQLAAECGTSVRTLDKYLELPLVSSWFLLEKVHRYRQLPDGQKQRDWTRYHVRLDDPLTPLHQAVLTLLAREIQARCQATSPLAQALEVAEGLLALGAEALWQRLHAGEQDPLVQQAAQEVTCPSTPQEIIEAVCQVEPTHPLDRTERESRITLNRVCDALYTRIVRPDKRQVASQYFRLQWMPLLDAPRAWLIMVLRAHCYWNEDELVIRDTCTVRGGYETLAASLGVSVSTIKTCLSSPPGPTFLTKVATRRPGRGKVEMDFRVEMIDPVSPADLERYEDLAAADQKPNLAGSPPDQKPEVADRPGDQESESAGSRADQESGFAGSANQEPESAGKPGDQESESATIWNPTKGQNLRNTKELISTYSPKENQQQQKEPSSAAADSSSEITQATALDALLQLGFQPRSAAQRYATTHVPEQIVDWCEYAAAEGLGPGYVRAMLDAGEPAPVAEEESTHSVYAAPEPVARPPSPRTLLMQQYNIAPETMSIWDRALGELQLQMTRATFDTWLRGSLLLSVRDGLATIGVRHANAVDWLQNRLDKVVGRTLARHLGVDADQLNLVFVPL